MPILRQRRIARGGVSGGNKGNFPNLTFLLPCPNILNLLECPGMHCNKQRRCYRKVSAPTFGKVLGAMQFACQFLNGNDAGNERIAQPFRQHIGQETAAYAAKGPHPGNHKIWLVFGKVFRKRTNRIARFFGLDDIKYRDAITKVCVQSGMPGGRRHATRKNPGMPRSPKDRARTSLGEQISLPDKGCFARLSQDQRFDRVHATCFLVLGFADQIKHCIHPFAGVANDRPDPLV